LVAAPLLTEGVIALYTNEQTSADKKLLPVKPQYIPEQLSLLSSDDLAELQCTSGSGFPREGEMQSSDTTRARRARGTKVDAIQDKLPGF
jgi:hypothetical protein